VVVDQVVDLLEMVIPHQFHLLKEITEEPDKVVAVAVLVVLVVMVQMALVALVLQVQSRALQ
tara:strand:+ start:255 stop:440 length:186 start_codon:yes stop_codon:yes gene_type:complete